jgi:chromatin segregation and condensation protein Rec8/ScpA/Scc1 (kleisin family)
MGPVCKHIVAVILYLQQDKLEELNLRTSAKSGEGNKKKTKSVSQQIKELLKTIPHRKLITFVEENSKKDKRFRNYFLTYFSHLSENQSIENLQP